VIEELPHGDPGRHGRVGGAEFGQVRAHGCVQVDAALLDEPHHRRSGQGLRRGTDTEDGVAVNGCRVVDVRDAVPPHVFLTSMQQADGNTRNRVRRHRGADLLVQRCEECASGDRPRRPLP
jgi:hypothetical protein